VTKFLLTGRNASTTLIFGVLLLSGCGSAPVEHYYTLLGSPPAQNSNELANSRGPSVTIASVTLPEAVDRSELVIRSGANRVSVMETQRWAESLKSAIPRAIADDLSQMIGGATVSVQSDSASQNAKYLLFIDVTRFDSVLNEAASIEALWSVRQAVGGQAISGKSTFRVPVHGAGFEELVAAHAQALASLSGEIATQIKAMDASLK
jgi:uncharacterized lipoprotein YmbA